MEDYNNLCIKWLLENNPSRLSECVNTLCKSKIDISQMNVQDIYNVILQSRKGEQKKTAWQKSTLLCSKCETRSVEYIETQSRGADEGMSTHYRCTKCLHLWTNR